jgi:hypothetical protein
MQIINWENAEKSDMKGGNFNDRTQGKWLFIVDIVRTES